MMSQSPLRRRIVSTFILLVIVSSIVPAVTLAGDASGAHATALSQSPSQAHPQFDGTIVAQQSGKDGSTTKNGTNTKISRKEKITALVEWLKVKDFGYKSLSPKEKRQIKNDLRALASRTLSKQQEKQRLGRITNILGYEPPTNPLEFATGLAEAEGSLNHTITNVLDEKLGGFTVAKKVPKYGDAKTIRVVSEIGRMDVGYDDLSRQRIEKIKLGIRRMQTREKGTHSRWDADFRVITNHLDVNKKEKQQIRQILRSELGNDGRQPKKTPLLDFNIGAFIDQKLEALKDNFVAMFEYLFNEIYSHTLGTPVPENSGWHQVFGTPTNKPYSTLYQVLLVERLYPVMNYFLGLGVLFLGASFTVNPFMSRFRIWDLLTKFVAGLMFYAFGWTAVTLLHGTVRGITNFIVPDPKVVTESAGTLLAFGASVPVAAALGGALTAASSLFGVGLILGTRYFLLTTVFPYIFGPLMLILYISPWQRLRSYASMALWQYVNILTMVIPMALVLRAAVALNWAFGDAVGFVFTIIGTLLFLLLYPIGSIYFFYRASGAVATAARSGMSTASSQIKSATERVRWGGSDSASDTSATGGESPGSQAQAMVDAEQQSESSDSTPSPSSQSSPTTTAQTIRDLYDSEGDDSMSPADMKEHIAQNDRLSTLKEDLDT